MRDTESLILASSSPTFSDREPPSIKVIDLSLHYREQRDVLKSISIEIPAGQVTAVIGPSGCGKSSLLRCFNRMNDLIDGSVHQGEIWIGEDEILAQNVDLIALRRRVGMVFQKPNPFPKSIYDNVAYGPSVNGLRKKRQMDEVVENALRAAALWDEVKDRLQDSALRLSMGQQQRLVIARAIAVEPEVLLLDEPASSLDPISTLRIEELIYELKKTYTILIVTHNMQQAARVSDKTAFLDRGELIEFDDTDKIFTLPSRRETEDYITGRYG